MMKSNSKIIIAAILMVISLAGLLLLRTSPDTTAISDEIIGSDTRIEIYKNDRVLKLFSEGKLVKTFEVALGGSPKGEKNKEGDNRTPIGEYYICTRNKKTKYTRFLGISYPNKADAQRSLDNNIISKSEYDKISSAIDKKELPPWNTGAGGAIGIHGGGNSRDWTWGCIALEDSDIAIIWQYADYKTRVTIYP